MSEEGLTVVLAFVAGLMLALGVAIIVAPPAIYKQLIEHDCGQYNSQTGEFEWKEAPDGREG